MRYALTSALTCILLAGLVTSGHTQEAATQPASAPTVSADGGNQVIKYQPDYFTEFQVSSALDMVFHVPGFSFNGGEDVRGFAGAAGNVLIDGQRPASKGNLQETLGNISSAQIDHVELIVGGAPGIDMQGYRQIVNVVRKSSGKPSLQFGGNIKTFPGNAKPAGFVSYSRNKGGKTTDLYIEAFGFQDNGVNNTKRHIYSPDFSDTSPEFINIPQLGGGTGHEEKFSHSRPFLGGKLSFNGDYNPIDYDLDARYEKPSITGFEHFDMKEIQSELGLQYEHKLGKHLSVDFNALRRHDRTSQDDLYTEGDDQGHYTSLSLSSEHIFSGKLTWQPNDKLTYKFGAETAFNSRDNFTRYTQNGDEQAVPLDKVRVEEDRNEYYVIRNWQATKTINVEAGLKVETSTISVKQDNRSQSFVYPKPNLQIVWTATDKLKLSWRTERVVGQLNFDDFASSVSLDTSVIKAGNSAIVPQKEWQNGLTLDWSFWGKGALTLGYKHAALEDTLDFTPIVTDEGVFNARGNIGEGTRDEFNTVLTLPTDKFHIKGGTLKVDYTRIKTSVTDPITHRTRAISGQNPDNYVITFDQNLTKYRTSWGVELDSLNNSEQYNATDYYHFKSERWLAVYVEYKTKNNVTMAVVVQNPAGRHDKYDRVVWTGQRDQSPLDRVEHNESIERPFLVLRIKKEL